MSYNVACDRCDFEATLEDKSLPRYDLGDGLDHYMQTQSAWCQACRSIVDAERLPTVTELLDLRAQMMESVGDVDFVTGHVVTEADVNGLAEPMVRWRANRLSPPRCLDCGSTEIVPHDPLEDGPFVHPGCGGMIEWRGGLTVECRGPGRYFDPEGHALSVAPEERARHLALPGGDRKPTP